MRIEIAGNIASGKTTLASILSGKFESIIENFRENPFWEKFYEAPEVYNFETEITFTLQHYHQIKRALSGASDFACDFSLTLDRAYADVTLNGRRHNIYTQILDELEMEVGTPDAIIFLSCPEECLLDRIRQRNRDVEKSISVSYLQELSKSISHNIELKSKSTNIVRIDSNALDFAHITKDQATVTNTIISNLCLAKAK